MQHATFFKAPAKNTWTNPVSWLARHLKNQNSLVAILVNEVIRDAKNANTVSKLISNLRSTCNIHMNQPCFMINKTFEVMEKFCCQFCSFVLAKPAETLMRCTWNNPVSFSTKNITNVNEVVRCVQGMQTQFWNSIQS